MKSIIITGTDVELNNALQKTITNYSGSLEIVYASPFSDELIQNIAFSQPDFIIADFLNEEQVREILESALKTTIVFISEDTNRTGAVISTFNKENVFDFINLDKSQIQPKDVLEQLKNYTPQIFEEIEVNNINEALENQNSNENNSSEIEENPLFQNENEIENNNENNNVTSYRPLEEPVIAKSIDNLQEEIKKQSSEKIMNVSQCQMVTLYSKKGGTGNTTIAKEIANIFANTSISKRLSDKETLDVCLVDFDFEQGNLRTILGITNPNPNLYFLIDSILTKMEQGIPLDRIYFAEPEFKINYCLKLKTSPMYVLCLGQGDIPKRLVERMLAFGDEMIFAKIVKKILQILKNCFNIVIMDTTSSYNDINDVLFKNSNKIIYPMEPTLADLENLKITLDETKNTNYITNKIIPVINKNFKSRFSESFLDVFERIQKEHPELKDITASAIYDIQVVNYNNNYMFYSLNQNNFKQAMITICHSILPIFKAKRLSDDMKIVQKRKALEKKQAKKKQIKEATKKINEEQINKNVENNSKENISEKPDTSTNSTENINATVDVSEMTVREYISGDLSKKDVNMFVEDLKKCKDVKQTKKGFPMCPEQPKSLDKKVWKSYYKLLSKNVR